MGRLVPGGTRRLRAPRRGERAVVPCASGTALADRPAPRAARGLRVLTGRDEFVYIDENSRFSVEELSGYSKQHEAAYTDVLGSAADPDLDVVEHGDGFEFHAPLGVRLAQVLHHGSDHRSQVCTALTGMGITPPLIDLWDYAEAHGMSKGVDLRAAAAEG